MPFGVAMDNASVLMNLCASACVCVCDCAWAFISVFGSE